MNKNARIRNLAAICLAMALSLTAWAQGAKSHVLLDESDTIAKWRGLEAVTEPVKSGKEAAKWTGAATGRVIGLSPVLEDWSAYSKLVMEVHSAKANGATIILTATSPGENEKGDYYLVKINVDWEGWKTLELPLDEFAKARKPTGWNKITAMSTHTKGWAVEPMADTELVLDNIRLVNGK